MGITDRKLVKTLFNPDEKTEGSTFMAIFVGMFAACGGILYGYDTGTISGVLAMNYVLERFPDTPGEFTSGEHSLIVSILSAGTFCGAMIAPYFSDTLGRRWTIILSCMFVFNVGVILQVAATDIPVLVAGRAIGGLGVGLISACVPLYQSETTPKWIRGAVVSCYQWAITIGLLLASCVNQGTKDRNDSGSYRIPFAIQFLWSIILAGGLFMLPETPRFYVKKGQQDKAMESLSRLRRLPVDHPVLIDELGEITANYEYEISDGKGSWLDCFRLGNSQLKRVMTGILLQAFQQLTGINFIFYYGTTFFKQSGIKNEFTITLATNIVNVGSTIPGIILVEYLGRRSLLLGGAAGMCVSQLIIAIVGAATNSDAANKCMVGFTCIFIAFFAATWGPVAWVITGEIMPLKTRAKSVALSTASNWLFNFAIAYATPYLVDEAPGSAGLKSNVFFIWGGCNFLCFFFAFYFIYETKNLTLEQVDELYATYSKAWQSSNFIPTDHKYSKNAIDNDEAFDKPQVTNIEEGVLEKNNSSNSDNSLA
ncbi:RGT2 [Cyberlindnera jadinii]|uniref:General substrate transporter n=1 Tax=Cyberlindnera jadinii (strain ATCC 18201 / CBS 1600 / BCRC 20928 / JCM 3617 / NBRC 0987 / NRRL Y-1542) TaxID=983966 RepID=A0A0H5CKW2_CYBJN|nr:general substrate transporter [Cyberlindnera jadinii NRRL Y-1542]ODV73835.1 general substrate transporter [Cyberlindnera jadinii NRRL Y-1542]CEP25124.1 RGT2 [Cyberlindnera jadinii]